MVKAFLDRTAATMGHRSAVDRFLSKIKEAAPSSMVTERFETPPG